MDTIPANLSYLSIHVMIIIPRVSVIDKIAFTVITVWNGPCYIRYVTVFSSWGIPPPQDFRYHRLEEIHKTVKSKYEL